MGKKYSENYIINIYKYMEFCGLYCEMKRGVKLSHKAAHNKLALRKKRYPDKITLPIHVSYDDVTDELVLKGNILLVKDDYNQIYPYRRPYSKVEITTITEQEREKYRKIREMLIEEELNKEEDNSLKPGEIKYQKRQEKRKALSL